MKKNLLFILLLLGFMGSVCAKVESVDLVPVEGRIFWRQSSQRSWQVVKSQQTIGINSEVSTASGSRCIVIFNRDKTNVVEVSPNSKVKVLSLYKVYLYEGEALALIRKLKKGKNFEVQTPTAISGARGTAWLSQYSSGKSRLGCLEDKIYVRGLDENGNPTSEEELEEGYGIEVGEGGTLGRRYELPRREREKLDKMRYDLGSFSEEKGKERNEEEEGMEENSGLGEAKEEASDNWHENNNESEREEHEIGSSSGGQEGDEKEVSYKAGE